MLAAHPLERVGQVGRQRRLSVDLRSRNRMREREPGCVQELAAEAGLLDAVDRVAGDRQPDRREMNPDLVRPAGLEVDAEQGVRGEELDHFEVRDGILRRVGVERAPGRIAPVTPGKSFVAASASRTRLPSVEPARRIASAISPAAS